jgi:hypothetical protein
VVEVSAGARCPVDQSGHLRDQRAVLVEQIRQRVTRSDPPQPLAVEALTVVGNARRAQAEFVPILDDVLAEGVQQCFDAASGDSGLADQSVQRSRAVGEQGDGLAQASSVDSDARHDVAHPFQRIGHRLMSCFLVTHTGIFPRGKRTFRVTPRFGEGA